MSKKLMVLGANAGQADLIRHAKDRGWWVIACSGKSGEPGQVLCDKFMQVDVTDLDALIAIARDESVDLVYSVSSDIAIRSATKVSELLGLPHFVGTQIIELLDNKAALRAFLKRSDVENTPYLHTTAVSALTSWETFPCIVKPVDAQGQRGVQCVKSAADLHRAIEQAAHFSRSGDVIIEPKLQGIEVSCNVLVDQGEICIKVLSERLVHGEKAFGVPKGHLIPLKSLSHGEQERARHHVSKIVSALGVQRAVLYFQMIMTKEGPRVVEIAPRVDGCHIWRLIKLAHGFDFIDKVLDVLDGKSVKNGMRELPSPVKLELMFQQAEPGIKFGSDKFPIPGDALFHEYRCAEGALVPNINGALEVVGYFIRPQT